jgi:hypothetical protein
MNSSFSATKRNAVQLTLTNTLQRLHASDLRNCRPSRMIIEGVITILDELRRERSDGQ